MAINYNKIRSFCRLFRIILGTVLIIGAVTINAEWSKWLFLGIIPLIAGLANFCPLCIITKKCDIPEK